MPAGRPVEWTKKKRLEVKALFEQYIDSEDMPILAEFCALNKVNRTYLYILEELSDTIDLCRCKKESYLERGALTNIIDTGMARFSLHQLGWKSEKSIEVNNSGVITFNIEGKDAKF